MVQTTTPQIGLIKLSDSDLVLENPEQDIRGKDACDVHGEQIGSVDDLYIDRQGREVRFLELGAGGSVTPPTADHRREGYASIPFGTADGTVDTRRNASPPFGRWR